jgi:signal transduction histidine kinase
VDSAITVHVTNVLRHAEGDIAYISIEKTADGYLMRFTNNGRPPCAPVNETGGLANLRRMTETIGGKMTINSSPQFEMILQLPERSQEEF